VTLVASPLKVVYGKAVRLSGLLSQGGMAVSRQSMTLAAQPFGASAFRPFSTTTTNSGAAYSTSVKPKKLTVYQASATGVATPPTATVKVAQLLKLSVARKGAKVYFKGSLAPKKRRRVIVIQVRARSHWKVLARVKTSRRSTFKCVKALSRGHAYKFRATTRGYPGLLSGTSRTVRLRK
jgi:hypothetical protein